MSDLDYRVRQLEEHQGDGCGCLAFLAIVAVWAVILTGHSYMIDNVVRVIVATPTPGVQP